MMGVCAGHGQLVARAKREAALAATAAGWTPAERAAFASLKRAEAAFADAHGRSETDLSGSGRGAFETDAEEAVNDAFAALVGDVEAGKVAPGGASDAKADVKADAKSADDALNAAYRALLARAPALAEDTTLTKAGLVEAERLWIRYRDAWAAFAKAHRPDMPPDALLARLSRDRAAQLKAVAGD